MIIMEISLPFITQPRKKKSKHPVKRKLIKVRNEYTPIEIQNMSMPELEYIYQHGSPTEIEIADNIIRARKKMSVALSLSDDILPSGSPFAGGVK